MTLPLSPGDPGFKNFFKILLIAFFSLRMLAEKVLNKWYFLDYWIEKILIYKTTLNLSFFVFVIFEISSKI